MVGHTEQAETVARSITDPNRQEAALAALAQALVSAGRTEQAETVARSITDPDRQASALCALVQALAVAGETFRAKRLAAVACQVGRWHEVVAPILTLDPAAAEVVLELGLQ